MFRVQAFTEQKTWSRRTDFNLTWGVGGDELPMPALWRALTVVGCCRGAGIAGIGIQGVRVAALPLRVPARAGGGEGGGRGVARVFVHLLELPLEKPAHGARVNSLQGEEQGDGRLANYFC